MMPLNVGGTKFTFIACRVDKLFPTEQEQIISKNAKSAILHIVTYISIAKATETRR